MTIDPVALEIHIADLLFQREVRGRGSVRDTSENERVVQEAEDSVVRLLRLMCNDTGLTSDATLAQLEDVERCLHRALKDWPVSGR